ncbi:ATP-binding cassette domain-containing protein, partial [Clostridiaceae bacterium OttesenSCG-928-D20]|nr:ATP-binding cassette domain-containing protein [Clostridiaceae bacterium OttesenSCG-928-D20]
MANEKTVLRLEGVSHVYGEDTPFRKVAIKNINLDIARGEILGIIGHTGSGKSTLIQHFNGLIKPGEGKIYLDGEDIHSSKALLRDSRFKVGLVFQYPEYQLFEETVYRDIAFGPKNMKLSESEIEERVLEASSFVGVDEGLFERSPLDLSGGQKRRVAIAGVLAMRPE